MLLAIFVFFFIPETKNVPLEEIDVLFGGANHTIQGENMLAETKLHDAVHIENTDSVPSNKEAHVQQSEV